jgi:hypothetical protein
MITQPPTVPGARYYQELRDHHWRDPPVSTHYPDVALLDDFCSADCAKRVSCGPAPFNNTVSRNIAINASVFFVPMPLEANFPDSNFNTDNNIVNPDVSSVFAAGVHAVRCLLLPHAVLHEQLFSFLQTTKKSHAREVAGCQCPANAS